MNFDPDRLVHWQVPDVNQQLTRRDSAIYAVSTGYGLDPLDGRDLPFVDPACPQMKASPSMALVLGYPGFWLGNPELGIDSAKVLHIEQHIMLEGLLPVDGVVRGETRIIGLTDRGQGRGALLTSERSVRYEGRVVARVRQTHLLRSEGGFGGEPAPGRPHVPVGEVEYQREFPLALPTNAALLYRLNGDINPLHSHREAAMSAGFERPIMHGMGTLGFVCGILVREVCAGHAERLSSLGGRFGAPCYPGDLLTLKISRTGKFRLLNLAGKPVVDDGVFTLT